MTDRVAGLDLHLERHRWRRVGDGLAESIRDAVVSGRLPPGTRLPSARTLAADLGIARNTVARVYTDLTLEGVLSARRGSGTAVAAQPIHRGPRVTDRPRTRTAGQRHDLRPGRPDVSSFPRRDWQRAVAAALAGASNADLDYGDPHGHPDLRATLAAYLGRARGVLATPDDIVVCSGATEGIELIARALAARGARTVAVESHGLPVLRDRIARAGLRTVPLAVDRDGADVALLSRSEPVDAVMLTPAHQFPFGAPLSAERRQTVATWARDTGGFVVEDDYDGEFRYDGQAVGALQGDARDVVVYVGSASKALAPGVRIGWLVVPDRLRHGVVTQKGQLETSTDVLVQLTFRHFVADGGYDRHLRGRRAAYALRRRALVAAIETVRPNATVTGLSAGLHLTALLDADMPVRHRREFGIELLEEFRHPDFRQSVSRGDRDGRAGIVIGFGAPSDGAFHAAVVALSAALRAAAGLPTEPAPKLPNASDGQLHTVGRRAEVRHGRLDRGSGAMRAVVAGKRGAASDGSAGLEVRDLPYPHLSENEVVVRVSAAGFTRGELEWPGTWTDRAGHEREQPVPGHELAGVVAELGYGTTGLSVGQRVVGLTDWTRDGTLAEYVSVEARNLAALPPDVDDVTAAALPISGLTAWQALFEHARIETGQTVLVHGAAGAVGSVAVQLAAQAGAYVVGTGRSHDRTAAEAAGVHRFVDISDGTLDAIGEPGSVDIAFDVLGGPVLDATVSLVRPGGTLVSIVGRPGQPAPDVRVVFFVVEADRIALAHLVDEVRLGRLTPKVDAVCSLDEAGAAMTAPGRTIVRVDGGTR